MTRADIDSLFELLRLYRQGDRRADSEKLRKAWLLVLEPYAPADVKQALLTYLRRSKFWPDPSEIAILCPPLPEESPPSPASAAPRRANAPLWDWWQQHRDSLHRAGLPTAAEHRAKGGSIRDYYTLLEQSGYREEP